jgi:hypothetical protein
MIGLMPARVVDVMAKWRPATHDTSDDPSGANLEWTWADEVHDVYTRICVCCDKPGHYQQQIVELVKTRGINFADEYSPISLGTDGRVWDGHHRLIAAMVLGIESVRVEV